MKKDSYKITLQKIRDSIDPEKEVLLIEGEYVVILDAEEPNKLKALFQKAGYQYVQIDLAKTVKFIAKKLAPHVDVEKFLQERLLLYSDAEEISELQKRLKGYAKVTEAPRCYSLMVGGKRGKPYEFNLVG